MRLRLFLPLAFVFFFAPPNLLNAQTATLKEIHTDGLKKLTEAQAISLSGLATGAQVGRKELQDAADALVKSGLFAKVTYNYTTHNDDLTLTFHLDENPRLPVSTTISRGLRTRNSTTPCAKICPSTTVRCPKAAPSSSKPPTPYRRTSRRTAQTCRSHMTCCSAR